MFPNPNQFENVSVVPNLFTTMAQDSETQYVNDPEIKKDHRSIGANAEHTNEVPSHLTPTPSDS